MSAPDHIAATPLPGGLMHVFGVDHYGRGFSFSLDPMVLHECAPHMDDAAVLAMRGRVHRDDRPAHDDMRGQETVS